MIIAKNKAEIRSARVNFLERKVAFVPTMGGLHRGHFMLMQEARKAVGKEGIVVVSIFLNPMQFNNPKDLETYPSTLETDLSGCEEEGVDIVFTPQADVVYKPDASVKVTEGVLSTTLCGATRPGHFDGVCTVVLKLYNLVQPDVMLFGEKDFQQLAIIQRMVRDLDIPVEILPVDTVRDQRGVALSSRNARLTPQALEDAPIIYQSLQKLAGLLASGEKSPIEARTYMESCFSSLRAQTKIDYLEVVDAETMQALSTINGREAILAIAVFFDGIRLIDHVTVLASEL